MTFDAIAGYNRLMILLCPPEKSTQSKLRITPAPSNLTKYAQKTLCTKIPLSREVTGKTFPDTEKNNKTRPSVRVHWVACGTCSVEGKFFQVGGSLINNYSPKAK